MKLGKSKLALAKVINENGRWVDGAKFSSQDKGGNAVCFYSNSKPKNPLRGELEWRSPIRTGYMTDCDIVAESLISNWHQTILSREEYYQAYPKADADGWIEWKGGECPVEVGALIDVKYRDLHVQLGSKVGDRSDVEMYATTHWRNSGGASDIIAYRLHKPDAKPEFCESVTRSIPGSESIDELCAKVTEENKHQHVDANPTIEQMAQDYRNAKDHADRLQKEADDAAKVAHSKLGELEMAGEALGLLIGIAKKDKALTIEDWRDLQIGDHIEIVESFGGERVGEVGEITMFSHMDEKFRIRVHFNGIESDYEWVSRWRFIRRP